MRERGRERGGGGGEGAMDGWVDVLHLLRCATPSAQGPLCFGVDMC